MDRNINQLHDYWAIIKNNKIYIFIPFIIILMGTVLLAIMLPDTYQSSATFMIENNPLNSIYNRTVTEDSAEVFIENTTQKIMNRESLREIIQNSKLYDDAGENVGDLIWISRIGRMRKNITIEKITIDVMNPRPGIATIGFSVAYEGREPEKVYSVAREVSFRYLEKQHENRSQISQSAVALVEKELDEIETKMQEQEKRIRTYMDQHSDSLPEHVSLNRDLAGRLEVEVNRIESDLQRIRQQKANLEINQNPDMQSLKKMQAELAAKETMLSSKHPDILILRSAIQDLEEEMAEGKIKINDPVFKAQVDAVNRELKRLQNKLAETKAKRDVYRVRVESDLQGTGEYRLLLSDYESLRQQQHKISAKLASVKAVENVQTGLYGQVFRLVESPGYPINPAKPNRPLIIMIGFGIAVGLGFIAVVIKSLLFPVIWSGSALAGLTQASVLAVIPKINTKAGEGTDHRSSPYQIPKIQYTSTEVVDTSEDTLRKNKLFSYLSGNVIADHYSVLKVKILERIKKDGLNTILLTSAVAGEGKSLTAINLALSLAKELSTTVVLVDADLRNPSLHNFFGFEPAQGISDYLFHSHPLEDLFINPGINKLLLLPGHARVEDSAEALGAPKMEQLIRELKTRYPDRYVIIDAPALNGLADTLILSKYADGVVMVIEAGKTTYSQILDSLHHLEGCNIIGFVLNKGEQIH